MCSDGPTTSYGYELSPGDEADPGDIPVCCYEPMSGVTTEEGDIDYTCGDCGTVLEISRSGVVGDIREKDAA
jgi:hypothetical protein